METPASSKRNLPFDVLSCAKKSYTSRMRRRAYHRHAQDKRVYMTSVGTCGPLRALRVSTSAHTHTHKHTHTHSDALRIHTVLE